MSDKHRRLVRQRSAFDCSIASIAMAIRRPYSAVLAAAGDEYDPTQGTKSLAPVLRALGLCDHWEFGAPAGDFMVWHLPWGLAPDVFRMAIWGRRALLCVPSLNNAGGWHNLFWDGRRVLDPAPPSKRRYSDWAQLQPTEIVIFREPTQ